MPFVKGKSGNPLGRARKTPDILEVEALCKEHTPAAIKRLVAWMKSDNPKASVTACVHLLDRAFGKPTQALEHKGTINHEISDLSDAELATRIKGELAALSGRGGKTAIAKKLH